MAAGAGTKSRRAGWPKRLAFRCGAVLLGLVVFELLLQLASLAVSASRSGGFEDARGDEYRVLCVGDSHTYGEYVAEGLTYPDQLATLLARHSDQPIRIINEGWPGRSTAMMYRKLPEMLASHSPDLLIVLGGANNPWNALGTGHWVEAGEDASIDRLLSPLRSYQLFKLLAFNLLAEPLDPSIDSPQADIEGRDEVFHHRVAKSDILAMIALARRQGADTILHSYPQSHGHFGVANAAIREAADESGIRFVDHVPVFERVLERFTAEQIFYGDGHLKGLGYRAMALDLAEAILGRELDDPVSAITTLAAERGDVLDDRYYYESYNEGVIPPDQVAYDFYNRVSGAQVEGPQGTAPRRRLRLTGEQSWRFGVDLMEGTRLVYRGIEIEEGAVLVFAVEAPGSCRGAVEVVAQSGAREAVRWDSPMDGEPVVEASLSLAGLAGELVDVSFEAAACGGDGGEVAFLDAIVRVFPPWAR